MHAVKITASLPFPVRVNPDAYAVEYEGAVWTLTFERVQRTNPDERIADTGTNNIDLKEDREGQLAYSSVKGEAAFEDPRNAIHLFVGALNRFISHVRDVFDEYWIRPVEPNELYQITVEINGSFSHLKRFGRGGAMLAFLGRTEEANARLVAALQSGKDVPVWRQMHLDARDALSLGRHEDCVVLAWSALEAACRRSLPGMAHSTGLSIDALANRLGSRNRRQRPPFSYEEAIEWAGGLRIVAVAAELTVPQIYDSEGVVASADLAYRLRNKIVHQGARVYQGDAQQVWESVDFVLQRALNLRNIAPPPSTFSWSHRFGRVRQEVKQFAAANCLRLIFHHAGKDSFFSMELIGDELWLSCASDMSQPLTSAFMRIMWDSWQRQRMRQRPLLVQGPPSGMLLSGSLSWLTKAVNSAVCFAESLAAFPDAKMGSRLAKYGASRMVAHLSAMPTLSPNDAREKAFAAQLAAYLAVLSRASISARLRGLQQAQPTVARLARQWAKSMANLNPSEDHSRCAILRRMHADAFWLDSIWVSCPVERVTYGSQRRAL